MAVNKRKVLDAARKYVQKGAKQKALKEFERLLKLDPKDGKLRLEIGDAHRRWGQTDEAVAQYQKVADQYKSDGFDARAVAVYKQVLNLDPKRYAAHVSLAELYQRMGLDSDAIAALQTAADGYHKEGKKREALELLRKMATLDPSNTTSRLKVADLLKQEGMTEEAVTELMAVAEEFDRQGTDDQKVAVYARILEIEPRRVDILTATARTLVQLQQPERAEPFAKKAVAADADSTDHYELLCDIYKALDRTEELAETTRALARIFRERGDEDRAREIMQRVPASEGLEAGGDSDGFVADPDEPEIADEELLDDEFLAGEDELELGDETPDAAEAFGESFDATDPDLAAPSGESASGGEEEPAASAEPEIPDGDPDQLLAEASVYLRYGKRGQAIASLKGVLAQQPDHRDALEKLGEAQSENGDEAGAVASWRRAAELARDAGDGDALGILCDRITAIDPDAVGDLADSIGAGEGAGVDLELELDAPEEDAVEEAAAEPAGADLDLDLEFETDDEEPAADAASAESEAEASEAPDPVLGDDVDLEIDLDIDDGPDSMDAPEEPGSEPVDAAAQSDGGSGNERIGEELEEAEFYFNQGLFDEAEAIYKRVLETAPNHPAAKLRMGEIEAARADGAAAPEPEPEAAPDSLEIDIDIDADDTDEVAGASDDSSGMEIEPELEMEEGGIDLAADASADVSDSADEPEADDGGFEIDLDAGDDSIDLAEAAAEAAAALDDKTDEVPAPEIDAGTDVEVDVDEIEFEDGLSTPTLEQVAEEEQPAEGSEPVEEIAEESIEEAEEPEEEPIEKIFEEAAEGEPEEIAAEAPEEPEPAPVAEPAAARVADETQPIDAAAAPDTRSPEDTFDLAAELRDVFEEVDAADDGATAGAASTVEDGFESIFSEFKKGVSATLTDADVETRYDLGIAYREMGLYEDAIGEFRVCLTHAERMVDGLTMMGLCALDLGRPADAIGHFEQALAGEELNDSARAGLSFDLGRAYEQTGDAQRARAAYAAVAEVDPDFPEIQERIQALAYADSSPSLQVDVQAEDDGEFESFEDLTSIDDEPDESPAESFESFDDVLTEAEAVIEDAEPVAEAAVEAEVEADAAVEPEPEPSGAAEETPAAPKKGRGRKKKISFV